MGSLKALIIPRLDGCHTQGREVQVYSCGSAVGSELSTSVSRKGLKSRFEASKGRKREQTWKPPLSVVHCRRKVYQRNP